MTDNQSDVSSAQKSLPSTQPPGWNDPPKWAFNPGQSPGTGASKRVLNKRVAFPLSSAQNSSTAYGSQSPKPVGLTPPQMCPTRDPSDILFQDMPNTRVSSMDLDSEKPSLNDAFENLQFALREYVSKDKTEEVQRRLDIMKSAWLEDEINDAVRQKILDISKALRQKNVDEADRLHIGLVMHHGNVCGSWISGIRHIILELKDECQQTSVAQAEQLCKDLLTAATAEM